MIRSISLICALAFVCFSCEGDTPGPGGDLPTVSIQDATITEGNENSSLGLLVELSKASSQTVSITYSTIEGTAKATEDFVLIENRIMTFDAGETSKEISIEIVGDQVGEMDETFTINISNAVNAQISRPNGVATILNDDNQSDLSVYDIPTSGYVSAESYPGLSLVWQDEFQASTISNDWTFEIGDGCAQGICGWGNNELEYYRKENAIIADDEYLVIQAKQENFGGKNYTSSRMITKGAKNFQYGRIDIRAAMPTGQGIWPALWMLGNNIDQVGWPACGEIDIVEILGHDANRAYGTAHWDNAGQHASYGQNTLSNTSLKDEFHVYSLVWDQTKIRWLLDDVEYNVIDITSAGLSELRQNFFFIFNVAVGGNWPGNPNASTVFPQRMVVDYIRVFQ